LVQVDRAGERAVVGQADRRHVELRRPFCEVRDPARPVEDGVLRVDVEVDEGRFGHGRPIVLPRPEGTRRSSDHLQLPLAQAVTWCSAVLTFAVLNALAAIVIAEIWAAVGGVVWPS